MGLNVVTDDKAVKVIRKDGTSQAGNPYTLYSIMYPFKQGDEWKNVFLDCQFKKGTDLQNKCKISIKDAFMTGSEFQNNVKPKLVIMDFEVVEQGEARPAQSDNSFMEIPDISDMPFN